MNTTGSSRVTRSGCVRLLWVEGGYGVLDVG
jgi:hypothetical protein